MKPKNEISSTNKKWNEADEWYPNEVGETNETVPNETVTSSRKPGQKDSKILVHDYNRAKLNPRLYGRGTKNKGDLTKDIWIFD